jgi:capsular polysaccharide biosynthesis protein
LKLQDAPEVAAKIANRMRWESYNAWVSSKRALLDLVYSPRRQRELLDRSRVRVESPGDQVYCIPAPAAIEPRDGYVVHGRAGVLDLSLPHSESARRRSERQYFSGVPTLGRLIRRGAAGASHELPLSVRHPYDFNYFHAVVDCFGAIALLDEAGLLSKGPLIVGPGLTRTAVFRAMAEAGAFEAGGCVIQDGFWIEGRNGVAFARTAISGRSLRRTLGFLQARIPASPPEPGVKLYVTRDSGDGRNLRNEPELRQALIERGFSVVDPGSLSWLDQVRLFRRATHVVGVHGAAFTNILFRAPQTMNFLEIQAPLGSEDMFRRMAVELGYRLETLFGEKPSRPGNRPSFEIEVARVTDVVDSWERS